MSYDIFISYRRKGAGAGVAGELQAKLENRGYKVFLDVDNIGSGAFPEQIDRAIKECNDFLLILSPGMMDRCVDEEDWVRHEIILAEQYGKNIIGVSLPGFVMPEASELPQPLRDVPEKQVFLWSHEYRNASFEKVVNNLVSFQRKKKRSRRNVLLGLAACLVIVVAVWMLLSKPDQSPKIVENGKPKVDTAQLVMKEFSSFVHLGDSLLKLAPNPMEKEGFETFMSALSSYQSALAISELNPQFIKDTNGLGKLMDSLQTLRKDRLNKELEAATKFLDVDQFEFAQFRFDNASILADEADTQLLSVIEQRLSKKK